MTQKNANKPETDEKVEKIVFKISSSDFPEPRAMKRKELREFRKAGLDPAIYASTFSAKGEEELAADPKAASEIIQKNEEMVDWILDNIYPDYDFDEAPNPDCIALAQATYNLTMGREVEIKNS